MTNSRLQNALTILPIISAGLYLLGFSYHQGYLEAFGIEDSLFPLATDKALLFGFFAFVSFSLVPMLYIVAAVLLLFFTVLVVAILSSSPRAKHLYTKLAGKLRSLCSKQKISPTLSEYVDKSGIAYSYAVGTFLVAISLILVTLLASKSGKEQAERDIASFKQNKGTWIMLHSPLLSSPTKAKQVICSTSHCAFWTGKETLILRHENVTHVATHNPSLDDK